jgi:hypothetical protein
MSTILRAELSFNPQYSAVATQDQNGLVSVIPLAAQFIAISRALEKPHVTINPCRDSRGA